MSSINKDAIQKVLENRPAMIVIMIVAAAGSVVAIVGGFLVTYKVLTFLGN
jgi:hypothetical protein